MNMKKENIRNSNVIMNEKTKLIFNIINEHVLYMKDIFWQTQRVSTVLFLNNSLLFSLFTHD